MQTIEHVSQVKAYIYLETKMMELQGFLMVMKVMMVSESKIHKSLAHTA